MIQNSNIIINILANCPVSSNSMGGGDRIFIELTRNWLKNGYKCFLLGCKEAVGMCIKNNLKVDTHIISRYSAERLGVVNAYILRIIASFFSKLNIKKRNKTVVYSASDFLPDIISVWKLKRRNCDLKWIVGFYLRMPNPFRGEVSCTVRSTLSYIGQEISIALMKKYVDLVFVLNNDDIDFLVSKGIKKSKIIVISGGVNLDFINNIEVNNKLYDSCFVGRFHPQKGLLDLIEVWKLVVEKKNNAILIIIGWGNEAIERIVCNKIRLYKLENNVKIIGFCDGEEKYKLLKASKITLFPSNHESWGIVVLESLACGVPVLAYDIPVLRKNFPVGVKFVKLGDYRKFAHAILSLIGNEIEYSILHNKGLELASKYSWENLAEFLLDRIRAM